MAARRHSVPANDAILIITNEFDPHADEAVRRLTQRGERVVRWHTADFPSATEITLEIDDRDGLDGLLGTDQRHVRLSEIRSVWYRRPEASKLPESFDAMWTDFALAQTNHLCDGLWQALDSFWISQPAAIRAAERKVYQLALAKRLGFVVPETLITNNANAVREFCQRHPAGTVIYKPLRIAHLVTVQTEQSIIERGHGASMVYTTPLSAEHLEHIDSVRWAPGIFQVYVPKRLELRITVAAGRVFAAAIYSQETSRSKHDWRRLSESIEDLRHEPYELPASLDKRVRTLVSALGLNFGAIDMILTPEGEYVFLEINPNGQFLWIEQLTDLPILDALLEALVRGHDRFSN